jgi:hypothetical protein
MDLTDAGAASLAATAAAAATPGRDPARHLADTAASAQEIMRF